MGTRPVTINWPLILDYVEALVWPAAIVALVIAFRKQLRAWFTREPSALELPGGLKVSWPEQSAQRVDDDPNVDELFAPYEDADFVEELRAELRDEVEAEVVADQEEARERLLEELVRRGLELKFERVFNRIFGSQVRLLEWFATAGGPVPRGSVEVYYQSVQAVAPALLTWSLDQYLSFLIVSGLIQQQGDQYVITQEGRAFLGYLQQAGYQAEARVL